MPIPDSTPGDFPVVPPTGDLGSYRNTIAYTLGELTTNIKHQSDDIKALTKKLGKLVDTTETGFRDQKAAIKVIEDKILVAETQGKFVFYTSKWFIGIACAVGGAIFANWSLLVRFFDGRGHH